MSKDLNTLKLAAYDAIQDLGVLYLLREIKVYEDDDRIWLEIELNSGLVYMYTVSKISCERFVDFYHIVQEDLKNRLSKVDLG